MHLRIYGNRVWAPYQYATESLVQQLSKDGDVSILQATVVHCWMDQMSGEPDEPSPCLHGIP